MSSSVQPEEQQQQDGSPLEPLNEAERVEQVQAEMVTEPQDKVAVISAAQPQDKTAIAPAAQPPVRTSIAAGNRGLVLTTLDDMWRFAQYAVKSGLTPKDIKTPEAAFVTLQMGAELGMSPMTSLQNIAVINGRPSLWGDVMLAVCRSSPYWDESAFAESLNEDGTEARCTVSRTNGKPITHRFSMGDAQKAGLLSKSGTPWQSYPRRMIQMRARSWALRDGFADVLKGIACVEEMRDAIDITAETVSEQPAGDQPRTRASALGQRLKTELVVEPAAPSAVKETVQEEQPAESTEPKPAAKPTLRQQAETLIKSLLDAKKTNKEVCDLIEVGAKRAGARKLQAVRDDELPGVIERLTAAQAALAESEKPAASKNGPSEAEEQRIKIGELLEALTTRGYQGNSFDLLQEAGGARKPKDIADDKLPAVVERLTEELKKLG